MNLKKIKYLTLVEASKLIGTSVEALCDWILENPIRLEARSELDNKYHPVHRESYEQVLAAADKKIEYVVFDYPKEYDKFKKGQSSRSDEQNLTRDNLRIPQSEFIRIQSEVTDSIGGVLPETYGVKKARRTRSNVSAANEAIISAAKDLLRENPEKYRRENGDPIYAKLAKAIDENRNDWPYLKDSPHGTSIRTIEANLSKFKDQLKVPKTYRKKNS